jgi:acyl-CoA hydrolase
MHLSKLPQAVRYGFLGPVHWAIVEACDVTPNRRNRTLTGGVGAALPTFCGQADRVLIELEQLPSDHAARLPRHLRARRSAVPPRDSHL